MSGTAGRSSGEGAGGGGCAPRGFWVGLHHGLHTLLMPHGREVWQAAAEGIPQLLLAVLPRPPRVGRGDAERDVAAAAAAVQDEEVHARVVVGRGDEEGRLRAGDGRVALGDGIKDLAAGGVEGVVGRWIALRGEPDREGLHAAAVRGRGEASILHQHPDVGFSMHACAAAAAVPLGCPW